MIEPVIRNPGGLLEHARAGQVIVDLSTASPASTRKLHDELATRQARYLDGGIKVLNNFLNGVTLVTSHAYPVPIPEAARGVASGLGAAPWAEIIWALVIVIGFQLVLSHTRWGLHTVATGGNQWETLFDRALTSNPANLPGQGPTVRYYNSDLPFSAVWGPRCPQPGPPRGTRCAKSRSTRRASNKSWCCSSSARISPKN